MDKLHNFKSECEILFRVILMGGITNLLLTLKVFLDELLFFKCHMFARHFSDISPRAWRIRLSLTRRG